jgi:hypothetical protein
VCGDRACAAQQAPGLDGRVGLDADVRLDPGRIGRDDRHAREHVALADPTLGHGRHLRQLQPVVDPQKL